MLPTKFQVNWPFGSGEVKNIFLDGGHGGHLGFPIKMIFAIFIYKSPWCFLPSFKPVGLWVEERKRKIDFQDGSYLGFQIGMILTTFYPQVTPILPPNFKSAGLSVQKKWKIDFQDSSHGGHLGFPIGTILAFFDLQVTPMLPTKFRVFVCVAVFRPSQPNGVMSSSVSLPNHTFTGQA